MSPAFLILLAIGLGLIAWLAGRARAWTFLRGPDAAKVTARPTYHAWYVALWVAVPMLLFAVAWSVLSPTLVLQSVLASPEGQSLPDFAFERDTILSEARAVATGAANGVFNPKAEALVEPFRSAIGF